MDKIKKLTNKKAVRIFDFLALGFLLALSINLVGMFFVAFFNGGSVLMVIDRYGEQNVEAILFPIFIVMGIISLIRLGRGLSRLPKGGVDG